MGGVCGLVYDMGVHGDQILSRYETDNRRGRRCGVVVVLLYLVVCAFIMFLTYTIAVPEPPQAIIVVDFIPEIEPPVMPARAPSTPEPDLPAETAQRPRLAESVIDTDTRVANPPPQTASVTLDPASPELPVVDEVSDAETPSQDTPRVNERALFPGAAAGTPAGGESGTAVRTNSPTVTTPSNSHGFSLEGRYLIGNLPLPAYEVDAEGRVVVRITVNASGTVTNATYEAAGSTTSHSTLVAAALAAARRARFTTAEANIQTGTVTYIFRLH